MKNIIIILLCLVMLLWLSSCVEEDMDDEIKDLKISAYLSDKNVKDPDELDINATYTLEQLQLNEVRIMAPIGAMGAMEDKVNLNLYFEFEGGIIEVISELKDIQLSVGEKLNYWVYGEDMNKRTYGWNLSMVSKGFMAILPLGSGVGHSYWDSPNTTMLFEGETGTEYYLTVNAYSLDNDKFPVAIAHLKIVQLKDKMRIDKGLKGSRIFSIELVSYEYKDIYSKLS